MNEGEALLGVKLDDEVLGDLEIDIVSGGQHGDFALQGVLIAIQPLGSGDELVGFLQHLEAGGGAALLANSDDVANAHQVGGDVDALAVDGVVAVVDQLTSLAAGGGKAQTVHNVIQTALNEAQQDLAGVAAHALGLLIVHSELLFQNAVNELDLLLLSELQAVFGLLGSSLTTGVLVGSLGIAHSGRRNAQSSATLQNRLSIFSHR